jgi:hypothetical protein
MLPGSAGGLRETAGGPHPRHDGGGRGPRRTSRIGWLRVVLQHQLGGLRDLVAGNYHRPRRYHRPLRNVFYMMALSSLRAEGPSKAFYQRKRDENKLHTQALLALARRLVDVLRALLRDNRPYSPIPPSQVTANAA